MAQKRKHYDLIVAYANGAELEWRYDDGDGDEARWEPCTNPGFYDKYEYRVKSKPVEYEWKWLIKHLLTKTKDVDVSSFYYSDKEVEWERTSDRLNLEFIQKIESTKREVE